MSKLLFYSTFVFWYLIGYGQHITVDIQESGVLFTEKADTVLFYQTAENGLEGKYNRSNYIHPLFSLDGEVLTEDFPLDHLHHRGVFWAWHQFYIDDQRIGDGWEINKFSWKVIQVDEIKGKSGSKSIRADVVWKSPLWTDNNGNEIPIASERTTLTVHPKEDNLRKIDIEISLIAMQSNTTIGGSEDDKGYGGFSARIRLSEDIEFMTNDGLLIPQRIPMNAGGWIDISGSIGRNGNKAGLTILSNPKNPDFPNPWILRSSGSMQNAVYPYPGREGVELSDEEPTILRYRLLVHNGLNKSEIASIYSKYN